MSDLPRLTRSLRVNSRLELQRNIKFRPEDKISYQLWQSKEGKKSASWKDFKNIIEINITDKPRLTKIMGLLQNLWKLTGLAVGSDENSAVIEDAAMYLFAYFLDKTMVMIRHITELKSIFGTITSQTANKICSVVCDLIPLLNDECLEFIQKAALPNEETSAAKQQLWGEKINCEIPKYQFKNENLKKLQNFIEEKTALATNQAKQFSMTYAKSASTNFTNKNVPKKKNFNRAWLLQKIDSELIEPLMAILKSKKSNDEIQDEMIDLLGLDKFDVLQLIFEHRIEIVRNVEADDKLNLMRERAAVTTQNLENRSQIPAISSQVVVQSEQELNMLKKVRKDEKKLRSMIQSQCDSEDDDDDNNLETSKIILLHQKNILSAIQSQPILEKPRTSSASMNWLHQVPQKINYPYVFDEQISARTHVGFVAGSKLTLPDTAKRIDNKIYEEVSLPANTAPPKLNVGDERVQISSLDEIGQIAFKGTKELNRIQSVVFNRGYHSNDNLLVCAPTGAGKTNVAMLTIVNTIRTHTDQGVIHREQFKIVYVAPMKALAAEMVANFGKKLSPLGISVRELTGDMQLTKSEIQSTQMLVTTPEKWDVVTRKGAGDVALISLVKLLIIDEVHLLHGERGPVVEAIVARTLRLVESTQSMIRIVGLSATLPNYIDVARFLRVNPMVGLYYFDSRFRPVPLEQSFIGVKSTKALQQMTEMDQICYDKCIEQLKDGYQVMVFVHARNATVRTAKILREMAQQRQQLSLFAPSESSDHGQAIRAISNSRNKQLAELFQSGIAMHHAGMLRSDRNLVEKYFSEGFIKVLVCTATLAWGVNLPAHAVVIKGTEIYDSKRGSFVDIGILDVLQIFGRAGRPQFEQTGLGIIITTHSKLNHYLSLLTNQFPIESNFIECLADNLNAEISLGTICTIEDAIEWLSYTYLFVRMRLNPQVYGLSYEDIMDDPTLEIKRRELIIVAAKSLDKAQMIRFNERTGDLNITDLGRTASNFYIKYVTVEVFNTMRQQVMTEPQILSMMSMAQEFQQLKVRDEELDELDDLTTDYCEVAALGGSANLHGKVNILMQTYLSRGQVKSFSLMSDLSYIMQNAVRIARAIFTIELHRNNAILSGRLLLMSKMFERQMWDFQTPLRQFTRIPFDIIDKIENSGLSITAIRDMSSREIGDMIRNQRAGGLIAKCAEEFPMVEVEATLQPITRTVLRIRASIYANFRWNDAVHGKFSESFWIWIEDPESNYIYHSEYFQITKKQVISGAPHELVFTIPLREPLPPQYFIRLISDTWLGSEAYVALSFKHLILPELHPPHTDLLPLQPLPVSVLNNKQYESLYPFTHFNPIQTQIFHCLYHTDTNVLLGAPTGSGKTIAAEMAIFRVFNTVPNGKVVYIAPMKALVRERIEDWKIRFEKNLKRSVVELTGDVTPDAKAIRESHVIVTTPEKWDGISRSWQTRDYVTNVALIVIDEIHLLGEDRGPVLEVIVSRTNFIASHTKQTLRIVGLSTALANARDLANWLGIKEIGLYNFKPSVRPVPLSVHINGFPGKHYCPRMATMNRPCFQAIRQYSPCTPAMIFVSSRRQTRLTALDLIAFLAGEDNPKQWMHLPEHEMDQILENIKDSNLKLTLAFGIGLHHAGLQERDRKTVEELFLNRKIQILIATATLAWGVNLPAHLVIIKGTEYYDGKTKRYVDMPITDVLQMMGRAGRPQFGNEGIAVVLVHDVKKNFYKKFLYDPFPVESSLLKVLPDHVNAEIVAGTVQSKQSIVDYFTWTYCFRRLLRNPSYYELESVESNDVNRFLTSLVESVLRTLFDAGCIEFDPDDEHVVYPTSLGRISSYYYLTYQTIRHFDISLKYDMTFEDILWSMCNAFEFDQHPVRHNEDKYNVELSKMCRYKVDALSCDSPFTKVFLLLQAHFSHLTLPNADFHTDTKSVLDQSIRIIQAMIDISAERGWLATVLKAQQLLQCVVQARWYDDSPVLALPGVEDHNLACFKNVKINETHLIMPTLKENIVRNYENLAQALRDGFNESEIEQIYKVLCDMPTLEIDFNLIGALHDEDEKWQQIEMPPNKDVWTQVHQGNEYTLQANFYRHGSRSVRNNGSPVPKVYCPKFTKVKDEGWFMVLGEPYAGELLALKRCSYRHTRSNHQINFTAPQKLGRVIYTVYVMSDSYIGFDQQFDIHLEIIKENQSNIRIEDKMAYNITDYEATKLFQ